MHMNIQLHVSEINAAIALFAGVVDKMRVQAEAQAQAMMQPPAPPTPPEEPPVQNAGGTD